MDAAGRAFSAGVELAYQGKSYRLTSRDLLRMAAVHPAGVAAGRPLTFDTPPGRALLEELLAPLERPPVDAVIRPSGDRKGFTVVPSSDGTAGGVGRALRRLGTRGDER